MRNSAICRRAIYVYVWADGVYLQARHRQPQAECMLVLMGATRGGQEGADRLSDGHAARAVKAGRSCSSI